MSRICVKNLPTYLTEERLRDHFAARGEVTDAKIMRTSDGRSRQLGFVGYRTEEEAQDAVAYFNRSFMDTFRLTCEIAKPIGSKDVPRPWSRHSQGSSAYDKSNKSASNEEHPEVLSEPLRKNSSKSKSQDPSDEDSQLLEFLQVMQPRSKTKLWTNDTTAVSKEALKGQQTGKMRKEKKTNSKSNSAEIPESKPSKVSHTMKGTSRPAEDDSDIEGQGVADMDEEVINASPLAREKDNWVRDDTISDMDYLKRRTTHSWRDDDDDSDDSDNDDDDSDDSDNDDDDTKSNSDSESIPKEEDEREHHVTLKDNSESGHAEVAADTSHDLSADSNLTDKKTETQVEQTEVVSAEQQESVSETGRLFVRNLSYTTSEEDLEKLFSQYGEISQVHLVLDKDTKRSKGYAYILYMLPECAVRAMEVLDKSIFQGRLLHILPAKRPPQTPQNELKGSAGVSGMNQFKQEREAKKRAAEASGNTQAWNSLFMRSDTVAENVARKYGLSKSDFLNPEAEDLAVRMALGETHIIAETKKSLSSEGVNIEILEDLASGKLDNMKRSNRVILVKNLPYITMDTDLVNMFGKFGSLERVILPPTKTLAMVVFLEASEARAAFKGLAYKRFKHVPLYLEWAPENILTGKYTKKSDKSLKAVGEDQVKRAILEQQLKVSRDAENDVDSTESRSVFVKNLNFKTSENVLKNHIQQNIKEGALRSVTIKQKKNQSGKSLSMGFGFIEFDKPETAKAVCKQLQGTVLDGHALVLQLSHGKDMTSSQVLPKSMKPGKNESSTKLLVRNVAFEATKKDLQQLFSPFGQIKSLRLPKKFDGNHRGFAFLEFITKQEAENAYNALSSTHLYGRHLVIEKAKEGESLEELRARTATQFSGDADESHASARPKKRKKILIDNADMRFGKITE